MPGAAKRAFPTAAQSKEPTWLGYPSNCCLNFEYSGSGTISSYLAPPPTISKLFLAQHAPQEAALPVISWFTASSNYNTSKYSHVFTRNLSLLTTNTNQVCLSPPCGRAGDLVGTWGSGSTIPWWLRLPCVVSTLQRISILRDLADWGSAGSITQYTISMKKTHTDIIYIYICIYIYIYILILILYAFTNVYISICLSVYLSINQSINQSTHQPVTGHQFFQCHAPKACRNVANILWCYGMLAMVTGRSWWPCLCLS